MAKNKLKKKSSKQPRPISMHQALNAMSKRSKQAIKRDRATRAKNTYHTPNTGWMKDMNRSDVKYIDTPPKSKTYKDFNFQMKNKQYKASDVIKQVKKNLKKTNTQKMNSEVNQEYQKQSKQALERNPNWNKFHSSKKEYLKSLNISKKAIKKRKQGELIQKEFDKTIHRRVKPERTVIDNPNIKNISDRALLKNLNIIRGVRKHEVGMKWKK